MLTRKQFDENHKEKANDVNSIRKVSLQTHQRDWNVN